MSLAELLREAESRHVVLRMAGDRLRIDAPEGSLTPDLKDALAVHKPTLLPLLAPARAFVELKGGLTVPVEALELALSLEDRGFHLSLDQDEQLDIHPIELLTDADLVGLYRWRRHVAALVSYEQPAGMEPR